VAAAEASGSGLADLDDAAFSAALAAADDDAARGLAADRGIAAQLRESAAIEAALASCDVEGGTAPKRVQAALAAARKRLGR
jgi:argininosuccinate lyase